MCACVPEPFKSLPLPEHPLLAAWAAAINDAGYWATVMDARWCYVFVTDELRLTYGDPGASTIFPIGSHHYSSEAVRFRTAHYGASPQGFREGLRELGPYILATTPGGREELRRIVAPELADVVDELQPRDMPAMIYRRSGGTFAGTPVRSSAVFLRIDHVDGRLAGVGHLTKPAVGMSQLAAAAGTADLAHLERMRTVARPDRHPAAILMADLEASSPLARRLSTAQYFAFGRRWVRASDQCVVDAGGIVGRHAGDGVVAYFLAETAGSESDAVRACITSARALRSVLGDVAARSDIPAAEASLRFGLHWGATVYMGSILTAGRSEVTALGDEMNEAARIEACATGGRALASKALLERLNRADSDALGLDTTRATYAPLAELPTATDKARRDAPAIAVCDLTNHGV
jgi:class 3 adenylate cyclase